MSRLPTIDIPGALYYLQVQSNGHSQLLASREELLGMRDLLPEWIDATGGQLVGYCLFQDSLHFVVRAGPEGIEATAQWLIDTHTEAHNRLWGRNGSLYSQQVLSVLIDPRHYLLPVMHKLHWLPVRAGLVSTPMAYPWSSHRDYLAPDCPAWLDRTEVLDQVANHRASQLRRFEHFIDNSRQAPLDWIEGINNQYRALAGNRYIESLLSASDQHQVRPAIDLQALTEWICGEYRLEEKDLLLWRHHRLTVEIQAMVGALARTFNIASVAEVADYFGCDLDVLAAGMRALQARRDMYLFKLQLRLDQWLIGHFQTEAQAQSEPEQANAPANTAVHADSDSSAEHLAGPIPVLTTRSSAARYS